MIRLGSGADMSEVPIRLGGGGESPADVFVVVFGFVKELKKETK